MEASRINALIASAYNIHVGPNLGGESMTPAAASKLAKDQRVKLCRLLAEKGGSDLYSRQDAKAALAQVEAE